MKREEITGELEKKLQKELHNLYSSINIINVIKSRTIVSVGHMTCKKERRNA